MKFRLLSPAGATLFALLFVSNVAFATTYNVGSLSDLSAKIGIAVAGDTIIMSNGVYTASSTITVSRTGTAANPILISAQTIGGVEITGSGSGISMSSSATYIVVQGFKFTHSSGISIPHGATHIEYTRNIIQLTIPSTNDTSYFNISADDVTIDYNELRNKSTLGEMLDISGSGSQVARRLWVHHNYFHDFTSPGGNGAETIRWGLSGLSLSTGNGLCEYNLFVRCTGENELISNKSSGNTYRYNTFLDSPGAQMSQRHGDNCLYYGNYFRNTDGMRVYGDFHKIFSNYFESNSTALDMGNGDGDVHNGAPLTSHDRPDNNTVVYNTFVNNSLHYEMEGRTGGLGSSNTIVANNIFQGGGNMASVSSSAPYTGSWSNNIRWLTSSAGNMPASGYTNVNPLLVKDASGAYHVQSGSPAINKGLLGTYDYYGVFTNFTYATNDMDGQLRDASPDIGADEFSAAPVLAKILTTNDVGPLVFGGMQFGIAVTPASQTVLPNSNVTYTVNITAINGTTGVVALAISGLPANTSAAFNPASVTNTGSSTVTITASNGVSFGSYGFSITGTSSNNTQIAAATLVVGDFLVSASPASQVVVHGSNAVYTVTVTTNGPFSGSVVLGATGLPPGATAGFVPSSLSASGTSTLTIVTSTNDPGGTYALTITGTGGSAGGSASASASLTVSGDLATPGWLMWKGTNNWSSAVNWTNVTTGGAGAPGISNDVVFADVATVSGSNTVNSVVDGDTTINSLVFTNTAGFHTVQINPGRTLSIVGTNTYQSSPSLNVGMEIHPATAVTVHAGITGVGGTLAVNNAAGSIQVRQGFGSGLVGSLAVLDLSGLGTLNADLRRIQIGVESGTPRRVAGIVLLARTNSIVLEQPFDVNPTNWSSGTPTLVLGHNTQAGNTNGSALYLGITNAIFVNHIVTGRGNQTNNLIAFNPAFIGSSPSLYLRAADGVSRVGQWTLGDNSAGSLNGPSSGTNDFSGGSVDAMVDRLLIGRGRNGTNINVGIGTLTFDTGTIDVNILRLGTMIDESSSTNASGVGTANVNGSAVLTVNTVLELAHTNTTAAATATAIAGMRGTLNLNGGTVGATNIIGAGGTSIINLNSGTLDLQPGWAGAPGIIANISTLNIGAVGVTNPALLSDAALITSANAITIASNGVLRGSTVVTSPALIVNGAVSPGSGAGTLTNNGPATFATGGRYFMEVSDAAAGAGIGWDYFRTTGALNITATTGSPFTLQLTSLNGSDPGDASNFNADTNYNFSIASAGGGITGFNPGRISINTAFFGNDLEGGYFFIQTNGASLVLSFTNNHPPVAATTTISRTGATLVVPISMLVTNWSDLDGDPVTLLDVSTDSTNGANNVGFDATNIYYTNATMVADAITYTVGDLRTNAPAVYRSSDTQRTAAGTIVVLPVVPPSIDSIRLLSGSLVLAGTGSIGGSYHVMAATNLSVPLSNWTAIATGQFDNAGGFLVTNAIDPAKPQLFFRLQVP